MANWTIIDAAAVKTGRMTSLLTAMQGQATSRTEPDPLPEMISDVVAQIRASISVGNSLDANPAKIPNSLKGLAINMVLRKVKDYLNQKLTESEKDQATEDRSYLNRIVDAQIRFETPDTAAASAEMQSAGGFERISGTGSALTRKNMEGLF